MYAGEGRERVAWNQAQTSEIGYTQPVVHDLGERDSTATGKAFAPPDAQAQLGDYAALGFRTAGRIPGAPLVCFPEIGHSPQIQDPARFHAALLEGLASLPRRWPSKAGAW